MGIRDTVASWLRDQSDRDTSQTAAERFYSASMRVEAVQNAPADGLNAQDRASLDAQTRAAAAELANARADAEADLGLHYGRPATERASAPTDDEMPSWMGGPQADAWTGAGSTPTSGHSASYDGHYSSNGEFQRTLDRIDDTLAEGDGVSAAREPSASSTDDRAEQGYADAGDRLGAAREALAGTRGQGQEAADQAGAEYSAAAAAWTAERGAVEDRFGADYGRGIPEDDADDDADVRQWNVHVKTELGRDDNVEVEAGSELEAERAAAQRHDVAVIIGAYPADDVSDQGAGEVTPSATDADEVTQDEASSAEESTLHTVTTQGHQLAVTTDEEEAVATVEAYQRAGYPELDVVTAAADADSDDHQGYPADAPWATPPPATAPDAEDEVSPERLDDENRATDWIREHDGEPAEGARPDPDSEFVWQDGALQYDGPRDERDEPTQVDPDAVAVYNERIVAGDTQEDAFGAAMSHQDEQRATAQGDTDAAVIHDENGDEYHGLGLHEEAQMEAEVRRDLEVEDGPLSSYFTDTELADADPNFSYGPDGEPRTRADATSEWVTDPDWDGTDIFAQPEVDEPSADVWEHWEKESDEREARWEKESAEPVDTAHAEVDEPADDRDTSVGVSRGKDLDDQVARAHDALTQLAAADPPSTDRAPAASTSDDNETRVR